MKRHPLLAARIPSLILAASATICLAVGSSARAEEITLSAVADGTLYESALNTESSGIGPTLFVGRIFQSGGLLRRGLVRFELPGDLPAGAQIDAAELGMRLSRKAPDLEDTTLTLHRVLQAWGEGTSNAGGLGGLGVDATDGDVTWEKSVFPSTDWSQPGGSYIEEASASVTVNELGDIFWETSPGMVDDLNLWLAQPELNFGWLIRGDETLLGTAVRLDSRENAAAAARPSLQISYSVPEPGTFVTLVIGGLALALCKFRGRAAGLAAFVAVSFGAAGFAQAQGDFLPSIPLGPHTIRFEKVADGLNVEVAGVAQLAPTDMVFPNDGSGRMFVTTLGGLIRVGNLSTGMFDTPYLNTVNEDTSILIDGYGMTAMTFHPGFSDPSSVGYKKFYTLETEKRAAAPHDLPLNLTTRQTHQTVLYEYTANDPSANVFEGTKRQVFRAAVPGTHDINELVFGPDGYLYVASGDGCNVGNSTEVVCSDNAQFLGNTFGKILRIDPVDPAVTEGSDNPVSPNGKFRIPADNPFVETPDARPEIYAYGLRNPYRLSFDRETDRLYVGDVGQRNIESVDEIIKGGNYGWNDMEGTFIYTKANQDALVPDQDLNGNGIGDHAEANGYLEPLLQYDHQDGKSVTGGYVYRGELFPELTGKYLFGDFRGQLNNYVGRMFLGDLGAGTIQELNISLAGLAQPDLIYAFSEDANGELYLLGGENDGSTGVIYRLVRENPYGDTNADGVVDLADLNNVRNNFGGTGPGDANLDGVVDLTDLNAVRNNFGASNPVPEPGTFGLLVAAGLGGVWLRRRSAGR
jgi:glucose/arabinose dehydrogenase